MLRIGWIHTAAAVAALAFGAAVLLTTKGTALHRRLGWAYVASMLLLNLTALLIYRLFGGFGPFHAAALVSLVTVLLGAYAALQVRRHRRAHRLVERAIALDRHYLWMTWSYVGLLAAAVSELATRVPVLRARPGQGALFGLTVVVATLVVVGVGARLIRGRKAALLAPYRALADHGLDAVALPLSSEPSRPATSRS